MIRMVYCPLNFTSNTSFFIFFRFESVSYTWKRGWVDCLWSRLRYRFLFWNSTQIQSLAKASRSARDRVSWLTGKQYIGQPIGQNWYFTYSVSSSQQNRLNKNLVLDIDHTNMSIVYLNEVFLECSIVSHGPPLNHRWSGMGTMGSPWHCWAPWNCHDQLWNELEFQ